jgi:V/A-type H+-transporting ATPase subunit D
MELRRLKNRLKTAIRGHKLLKDKTDETVRRFMIYIKENHRLRSELENELPQSLKSFLLASAVNGRSVVEEAVAIPSYSITLKSVTQNIMSINVPQIEIVKGTNTDLYPYSFASVSAELDFSIISLSGILNKLIKLAEIEKTCNMLADEIEKSRRRVNALEYVMIPDLTETIKYITMKLDENERANTIRLMKVKSIINDKSI